MAGKTRPSDAGLSGQGGGRPERAKALTKGHSIDVYKSTFRPLLHTLGGRNVRTQIKLIVDSKTDKVLGCHILRRSCVGDHPGGGGVPEDGATKEDFDGTMALHPTAAEDLVTMRSKNYSKAP